MIHRIPKPEISSEFTIDDIHKIREWNYERLKDATDGERIKDISLRALRVEKELIQRRSGMSRQRA